MLTNNQQRLLHIIKNRVLLIKLFIICIPISCVVIGCSNVDDSLKKNHVILSDLEKNHFQNVSIKDLHSYMNSKELSERDKDFIKYYIFSFVDDHTLVSFIENKTISTKKDNIYSLLLEANKTRATDTIKYKTLLSKAQELNEGTVYLYIELMTANRDNDSLRKYYLKRAIEINGSNEIVLTLKINEDLIAQDSINFQKTFLSLKSLYSNYYTYSYIGGVYKYFGVADSAIHYYRLSLQKKETIGAYIQLSNIYYYMLGDVPMADSYLKKAMSVNDTDEELLLAKAWFCYNTNDTSGAVKTLKSLILIHPTIFNYKELCSYYLYRNQILEAKNLYSKSIEKDIPKKEQMGYFLVFNLLENPKNQNRFHEQIDSIKKIYGMPPIEIANEMLKNIAGNKKE